MLFALLAAVVGYLSMIVVIAHGRRASRALERERKSLVSERAVRRAVELREETLRSELVEAKSLLAHERMLHGATKERADERDREVVRLDTERRAKPHNWVEEAIEKRVVVHTVGDISIEGFLSGSYEDCVVLKHAFVDIPDSGGGNARENLEGDQVIPRANIHWIAAPQS